METPNELEMILLTRLILKYPALKTHIAFLRVSSRQSTNNGLFVYFTYDSIDCIKNEELNALFSTAEKIQLKSLKNGLSYVVDITAGAIEYIEFSTYNEKWDGIIEDYQFIANAAS